MHAYLPVSSQIVYKIFKYAVYVSLTLNIFLFFQEESLATQQTFSQGIGIADIIQGFAATIDTAAWVFLLMIFELTTSVFSPNTLSKSRIKLIFTAVRIFCYGFIFF